MDNYTRPTVADRGRDLSKTWYVTFTHLKDGVSKRERIYNGRRFGIPGNGNALQTVSERKAYFNALCIAVDKALLDGSYFSDSIQANKKIVAPAANLALLQAIENRQEQMSGVYYKNLLALTVRFSKVVPNRLDQITPDFANAWLDSVAPSAKTFNNYRRDLHVIFEEIVRLGWLSENPFSEIRKRRTRPTANEAYTPDQLRAIFEAASEYNQNLYVCLRLMFHAFFRPHQEVRLCQRKHIDFESGTIIAPATSRKGGDVLILPMSAQLREALEYAKRLHPDAFIIGWSVCPVNDDYFKTLWRRFKNYLPSGTIRKGQTLYSVRHSAACMFYQNTKDVEELRRAMGHTDLKSTIVYLRSLGVYSSPIDVNDLPSI